MNKFEKLGLSEELLKSINELGLKNQHLFKKILSLLFWKAMMSLDKHKQEQENFGVFKYFTYKFKKKEKRNHRRIFYHQQENLPCKFMKN